MFRNTKIVNVAPLIIFLTYVWCLSEAIYMTRYNGIGLEAFEALPDASTVEYFKILYTVGLLYNYLKVGL